MVKYRIEVRDLDDETILVINPVDTMPVYTDKKGFMKLAFDAFVKAFKSSKTDDELHFVLIEEKVFEFQDSKVRVLGNSKKIYKKKKK